MPSPIPIVVFAQVPPPEHGQSRMVLLALNALREKPESFEVHHINSKFSNTLEEIGEGSIGKSLLIAKYLAQAVHVRLSAGQAILYYVPGPTKWSAVLRDWILLLVLRRFYSRIVFHWHAIGQGEWAHGSGRLRLSGPRWLDRLARKISARILDQPLASISVSDNSGKDAAAVASGHRLIIYNGLADPCPDFDQRMAPLRLERSLEIASSPNPCFKLLFLSHGTLEKGILDALDCLEGAVRQARPDWFFRLTFAGGVSDSMREEFDQKANALRERWPDRIGIIEKGYLTGEDKEECFVDHDIFLSPSHWESFGLTVIEAMAYGMPIVAAASDGVEGVLPSGHPYLAPVASPEKLASKLVECCTMMVGANGPAFGQRLRERFLALYQIEAFKTALTEAFLKLSQEGSTAPARPSSGPIRVDSCSFVVPSSSSSEAEESVTADSEASSSSLNVHQRSSAVNPSSPSAPAPRPLSAPSAPPRFAPSSDKSVVSPPPPSSSAPLSDLSAFAVNSSPSLNVHQRSSAVKPSSPAAEESATANQDAGETPTLLSSIRVDSCPFVVPPSSNAEELVTADRAGSALPSEESKIQNPKSKIKLTTYLADQNPGHDRSFGISRMSQVVLSALQATGAVTIEAITSKTSQQAPEGVKTSRVLPWGTRTKWVRLLTDHFHPLFARFRADVDIHYFPKGYLPLLSVYCRPSVVTIHDTIIQYDEDHYPKWRKRREYAYWAMMLKHTLKQADRILTVSWSSKRQIEAFMNRHGIPRKEITVTYEPCLYEEIPQPEEPAKENYVVHLASVEPHKRTTQLIRWWHEAEAQGRELPMLHLIGSVPPEVAPLLASSHSIVKRPFLEDSALQAAYTGARALILSSEIEGFGLPALEAYYLGTPVCFVKGTSVEEVLGVATGKGGFSLDSADSLFRALDEVMGIDSGEIRETGLKLRETYASAKVAERMMKVFEEVGRPR
jgi:glycosyltransferase involved in cell wall biosynthesis